ncbi:DNA binding domain-containing protein, excisionase family [Bacteroides ovatus]|jgi:DNA binding domain, excisionase family|uniref:DNA binding domain-containing protein, excisionase family n=1 Tax=Bacteroides ovatus TaxID=28116 RepID=A0A1G6G4S1_BACOV|nr:MULTISPECIES: helix-turn-helix domain-containing protein [Bacteroidales]KKB45426.1 excisionase family DNA binding domain-containing protein [Parabacteroides sp. HGS0025]SDB76216.1 DNA binding domain-containing protein, excisionase family [Bacteroides ovatus]
MIDMTTDEMTFNDVPQVVAHVYNKVERLETLIQNLNEELRKNVLTKKSDHTPMTLDEACEFLKMKKSTMYYKLGRGDIPGTRSGKYYILFKDELIKWIESGRNGKAHLTPEEENELIALSHRRKSKRTL